MEKLNSITSDHDRLELEVLCSRSTSQYIAASVTSEDFNADAVAAIYKQKYERCCRDLEFMKEKLRAQHEDDLDQMVSIEKQLEKKCPMETKGLCGLDVDVDRRVHN
ncbi:hypothetical protein QYM36_010311 [Artemia franciscana]|uniref:Uncharacterized protein n=1 Tax=Artemia franciscana TaxID=6661 RepID=A0AA88L7C5_ARTSF|nr:hypothetical protein QYM36_010311 [Artemia franciscana]